VAIDIVEAAAQELGLMGEVVIRDLAMAQPRIAFAGGLLESENAVTRRLCARFGLAQMPIAIYPPVVGAALLAQIDVNGK